LSVAASAWVDSGVARSRFLGVIRPLLVQANRLATPPAMPLAMAESAPFAEV